MYTTRWNLIKEHIQKSKFVLIDWGSDAGWFSVNIAHAFPEAAVVSVEAGIMSHGNAIRLHIEKVKMYELKNNILVESLFGPDTFTGLRKVPSDFQLVLSVFHHMGDGFGGNLRGVSEWDLAFCDLISGSNITFLELPNEASRSETPHRIREWYSGRDVETVTRTALERRGIQAAIEQIGETQHGVKGMRKLFKISLETPVIPVSAEEIVKYIRRTGEGIRILPYRRFRLTISRLASKMGYIRR
jgi:hypothetical protein